ncbi:GntR family transcriptional regulator [Streptomyces sp. NPDC001642]|uniref:GntR family transcriptional regulator n=1 Tax=Streptomyces sp. NPDC001642 TaxID=3154392 RepID=UPI0033279B14
MPTDPDTTQLLLHEVNGLDPKQTAQADGVYRRLRESIQTGEIPPGASMDSADLAAGYKIDGEVLRAVLKGLARDGLTRGHGRSVYVTAPSERRSGQETQPGTQPAASSARAARYYSAFGENKTLSQWAADPRCRVNLVRLFGRIRTAGWDAERAITTPLASK